MKKTINTKETQNNSFEILSKEFGFDNKLAAPRITKISVAVTTGRMIKNDRKKNEFVIDRLAKITGQKGTLRKARKSIASFKIREGDQIGVSVTLRGKRMYDFLDKIINIALPRTKDFRGIKRSTVDNMGNMTFGIKEHTIFPEIKDEEIRDVFGMAITIVSTAKSKNVAARFFEEIGIPFAKEDK